MGKLHGERWDHGLETDEILTDSQNGMRARRERSGVIVIYRFVTEALFEIPLSTSITTVGNYGFSTSC